MGIGRDFFKETARTLYAWIGVFGMDDGTVANHVVDDDDCAWAGEANSPFEIDGIVLLVGVDEDEIERRHGLFPELFERVESGALPEFDD